MEELNEAICEFFINLEEKEFIEAYSKYRKLKQLTKNKISYNLESICIVCNKRVNRSEFTAHLNTCSKNKKSDILNINLNSLVKKESLENEVILKIALDV